MKQYLDLLQTILDKGVVKESGRAGMPNTKGVFGYQMRFDLEDGFPLLTTKKMPFKIIAHELIWFLRGDTNIKYLVENSCNIWNGDAYRHYKNIFTKHEGKPENMDGMESFLALVKDEARLSGTNYRFGDLGDTYGVQWRNWTTFKYGQGLDLTWDYDEIKIDQIKKVIEGIKNNPFGRRHIVLAWNPAEVDSMALPPCHLLFQFNCRPMTHDERMLYAIRNDIYKGVGLDDTMPKFYLDCLMYQRSADTFLGVPFNIASYALMVEIVAKMCNMVAGEFTHALGDTHIYSNHMDAVSEQLKREPMEPCRLKISDRVSSFNDIAELTIDDLSIENYVSHPAIKAELSVGI